ncbi:MAG: hypothetical protein CBC29_00465 [Methylococcaceae bacterium TMED69]|nr:MAG: hypothetical protein CBC29_00465 [Methylococcaceae bacterium TMED69]|tara:strand:- start:677 stop:1486 length:810 start_codon:yes stop_codon:yes gene_type:complete
MPEGPEVRIESNKLNAVLSGKVPDSIWFEKKALKRKASRLKGKKILKVTSLGKAILCCFESGHYIYSHNQLYGKWAILPVAAELNPNRIARIILTSQNKKAVLYSASSIEILDIKGLEKHSYIGKLGPDVLDKSVDHKMILSRLLDRKFRNRAFASLYLDQNFLAGIGNYLRTEILWAAGLSPFGTPSKTSEQILKKLAKLSLSIPRRSLATNGWTLTETQKKISRAEKNRFAVFARQGKKCLSCDGRINKIYISGRRLYKCDNCQPII